MLSLPKAQLLYEVDLVKKFNHLNNARLNGSHTNYSKTPVELDSYSGLNCL